MTDPAAIITIIGSFFTGLGALVIALVVGLRSASKTELDAVVTENKRLRERVTELEDRLSAKDKRIEELQNEIDALRDELEKYRKQRRTTAP